MSKQHDNISKGLKEIGAAWANNSSKHISPNDPGTMTGDAKATYHVMPSVENPYQSSILRFDTLAQVAGWVKMCKAATAAETDEEAEQLNAMFWMSIDT